MDLDGTLTQHKSSLGPQVRQALDALGKRFYLLMVGAGSCARIYRQMDGYPVNIIGNYGMQQSTVQDGSFALLRDDVAPGDRLLTEQRVARLREELGFTQYAGDSVEFHSSGLVTFPILGTAAQLADKLRYDPDRCKRRAYYPAVCQAFPDYTVFIGGSSSYDLAPPPYSKLYALQRYLRETSLAENQVVYFGDDYGLGGNDADIYHSGIRFICVDDYTDFPVLAQAFFDEEEL